MKKYKIKAYALNHIWYREDWIVEAKSQKDAIAKANSQEGELEYSDQSVPNSYLKPKKETKVK